MVRCLVEGSVYIKGVGTCTDFVLHLSGRGDCREGQVETILLFPGEVSVLRAL